VRHVGKLVDEVVAELAVSVALGDDVEVLLEDGTALRNERGGAGRRVRARGAAAGA
jgi:hypothetical protein